MSVKEIVLAIVLAVITIVLVVAFIIALARGEVQKKVMEFMAEAEEKYKDIPDKEKAAELKRQYVIDKVKEKYHIIEIFMNLSDLIEFFIKFSKNVNFPKNKK